MVNKKLKYTNMGHYFIFLLPCILLFLFFYAYPTITVFVTSITKWKLGEPIEFNGIENFIKLFQDEVVIKALINTIKWMIIAWVLQIGISLLVALLTRKISGFNRFVKVTYLIPNMISLSVIGFISYFIFNPSIGIANEVIRCFVKDFSLNWYQDISTAFFTVTITTIFYGGISTLMMSSEIAAIPEEILESARIDGASEFQLNIKIILPMIKNIIGTTLILATVNALKSFEVIYMTTNGGPGSETMNFPILIYRTAMLNNNYGYSNALSIITILIGIIAMLFISKIFHVGKSDY